MELEYFGLRFVKQLKDVLIHQTLDVRHGLAVHDGAAFLSSGLAISAATFLLTDNIHGKLLDRFEVHQGLFVLVFYAGTSIDNQRISLLQILNEVTFHFNELPQFLFLESEGFYFDGEGSLPLQSLFQILFDGFVHFLSLSQGYLHRLNILFLL